MTTRRRRGASTEEPESKKRSRTSSDKKTNNEDDAFSRAMKRRAKQSGKSTTRSTVLDLSKSGFDPASIKWYKIEKGSNNNKIDIIPFTITQDWYESMKEFKGDYYSDDLIELPVGELDCSLTLPIHRDVGIGKSIEICLSAAFNEPCPICEERDALKKKGDTAWEGLKTKWRCFYNVVDLNKPEEGIKLWDISYFSFEKWLQNAANLDVEDGYVAYASLKYGKSIIFGGREEPIPGSNGKTFIDPDGIHFVDRKPYEEDILNESFPLDGMVRMISYDELADKFYGIAAISNKSNTQDSSVVKSTQDANWKERKKTDVLLGGEEDKEVEQKTDVKCPYGHKFGIDTEDKDDCNECNEEIFNACCDEKDKG